MAISRLLLDNASSHLSADTVFPGTPGDDNLTGSSGDDFFNMTDGGNDTVKGLGGNDVFAFGAALTKWDRIDGGLGSDSLLLNGDYSQSNAVVFQASTMVNVENLTLAVGHSYDLTLQDANVAAGATLTVSAGGLGVGNDVSFDASADTNSSFNVTTGGGVDNVLIPSFGINTVNTGANTDDIDIFGPQDGHDTINAGAGDDYVDFLSPIDPTDVVDGGSGFDDLTFSGWSTPVTLTSAMVKNFEKIDFTATSSYKVTFADSVVMPGQVFQVDATHMDAAHSLVFDGSAEKDGSFNIVAGPGNDVLKGGAGNDVIDGGDGGDSIFIGAGSDTATGGAGFDNFYLGANFDPTDQIDGGTGNNFAYLDGDYSAGLTIGGNMLKNISTLVLDGGNNYKLTLTDAAVQTSIIVTDNNETAAQTINVDGSPVLNGSFAFNFSGLETLHLKGGAQDDEFNLKANGFNTADTFDGGGGNSDYLSLYGDLSTGVTFQANTMKNIEYLTLSGDFNDKLTLNDGNVAAGKTLWIEVGGQTAGTVVTVDGSAETDGQLAFSTGSAGTAHLTGGAAHDSFFVSNPMAGDQFDGGGGYDTLLLTGGTAGVVFAPATIKNIETVLFYSGHNYNVTTNDANVAAGQALVVDAHNLGAADKLAFHGSAETNGYFVETGGAGNDTLEGGAKNDTFIGNDGNDTIRPGAGNDTVDAGAGNDTIAFTAGGFNGHDAVDGGTGIDTLTLSGDYSAGITLGAATLLNVEIITFAAGDSYKLASNDATVGAGKTLTVNGSSLGATDTLTFNGAAETDGHFIFKSGLGGDVFNGGHLADTFVYATATDSSSVHYDTIGSLNFALDRFDLPGTNPISGIDPAFTGGALDSGANFDSELHADLAGHLGAHHAVIMTAGGGTLQGSQFLVADLNGNGAYDANTDIVLKLGSHLGTLATSDFI